MDPVNRWTIVRPISRGSIVEVYEIRTASDITCIGEFIRLPLQADEPDSEDKLKQKFEAMQYLLNLEHEYLVKVLGIEMIAREHTIVIFTDLINGRRLENILKENGRLMEDRIKRYAKQICRALEYLHHVDTSAIHRIISSFSVMITTESDDVKLVDYGASVQLLGVTSLLRSECKRGLPQYMAPELLKEDDDCKYGCRTDIWAFGCLVYEMATGKRPHYDCGSMLAIGQRVKSHGAPPLPITCSDALRGFYAACTAVDWRMRMSAAQLLGHDFLR